MTDWVAALCRHVGVHAQYKGFEGQTVDVAQETCLAVLAAMELDVTGPCDARKVLKHMKALDAQRPAPHEVVVGADQPSELEVKHPVTWALEAEETGELLGEGKASDRIMLPTLPPGIHRLRLRTKSQEFTTWILARPDRAFMLEDCIEDPRIWGISTALYGLTDGRTVPIGTYDLLGQYAAALAKHGADFLAINPIHAMGERRPDDVISPYSPSHRGFLNTWHCKAGDSHSSEGSDVIDYTAALRANDRALSAQFADFSRLPAHAPDRKAHDAFIASQGAPLSQYALFEALAKSFGPDWREWPAPYRNQDRDALAAFESAHGDDISRTKWAQWQAERQLAEAQLQAKAAGMRIGLYLDLAVGPRLGGAETWDSDTSLVTKATMGAPPDPLGPLGQSWGLAPQSPLKCREQGFRGFARLLRSAMRHAGMIRIDHVIGLMRSFWIPEGCAKGTFVNYPFDAMLAVIAIESARNQTVVIGEDLGLVPEGLREKLSGSGIYGLDVLQYMRSSTGGFVDTADTRELAVCAFATHDTPTITGFFEAEDVKIRCRLNGIDKAQHDKALADRQLAKSSLAGGQPVAEIHRRLARARSAMVAVQLDDIAERALQQNLPGTIDEYPNWQMKAPFTVKEIITSDTLAQLGADMRMQHRSNPKSMEKEHDLQNCPDLSH